MGIFVCYITCIDLLKFVRPNWATVRVRVFRTSAGTCLRIADSTHSTPPFTSSHYAQDLQARKGCRGPLWPSRRQKGKSVGHSNTLQHHDPGEHSQQQHTIRCCSGVKPLQLAQSSQRCKIQMCLIMRHSCHLCQLDKHATARATCQLRCYHDAG